MAIFGAPFSREADADHAFQKAMAMHTSLKEFIPVISSWVNSFDLHSELSRL